MNFTKKTMRISSASTFLSFHTLTFMLAMRAHFSDKYSGWRIELVLLHLEENS